MKALWSIALLMMGCAGSGTSNPSASNDGGDDGTVADAQEAATVKLNDLCCKMDNTVQLCNSDNTWECYPGTGNYTYPCDTPLVCQAGQYCIGVNGPGTSITCH